MHMKSTGVVRKIDELGRFVLPIELRKNLRINNRDSVEIFVEDDKIILKKYEPSCVFCGAALILYSYIAMSGVKTLKQVDLENQKNLLVASVALSLGISGLAIGGTAFSLSGVALAVIVGIILNLVLKDKEA